MSTPPIACSLTADQMRCEASVLLPGLSLRADRSESRDEGLRLWFAPTSENLQAIVRTVDRERGCCAFLDFQLHVPHSNATVKLEISGPPGTRNFLLGLGLHPASAADHSGGPSN